MEENEPSLLEVLTGQVTTEDGIYPTSYPNLFVIPADLSLFKVSDFLASSGTGAFILKLRLKDVASLFDYAIVDVQPSRSQICLTALGAADLAVLSRWCSEYRISPNLLLGDRATCRPYSNTTCDRQTEQCGYEWEPVTNNR